MFDLKPDYEEVLKRYEAWWHADVADRPLTIMHFAKPPSERIPTPQKKTWRSERERWLDFDYTIAAASANTANYVFFADTLPVVFPNLGPDVFASFYGCPLEFGANTSWSEPILKDWRPETLARLRPDQNNFYFKKILEFTDAMIEAGRGRFIVGYTDLHPGADALAAFRDPQQLCLDLIEHPNEVKALCDRVTEDFLEIFDVYHERLRAAGMPSTTWLSVIGNGRVHVPSNDFSCMISREMFQEFFLPGLARECRHMARNIYHLDGPQAIRHMDAILDIPNLHAIQWVPGSGREDWKQWIPLFQKIQAAGKAFDISLPAHELDLFFSLFKPRGVRLITYGPSNIEEAQAVLRRIEKWGR